MKKYSIYKKDIFLLYLIVITNINIYIYLCILININEFPLLKNMLLYIIIIYRFINFVLAIEKQKKSIFFSLFIVELFIVYSRLIVVIYNIEYKIATRKLN